MEGKFEKASRMKLRYATPLGSLTTEDLWDLPLLAKSGAYLDDLAKALNKRIEREGEESFVIQKSAVSSILELKFDIVKHIIKVKLEEQEAAKNAAVNKARKDRILEILAAKEDQALMNEDPEKLRGMINEL